MDSKQIQSFYQDLYQHCEGRMELRAFAPGRIDRRSFVAVDDYSAIQQFFKKNHQYNVYFGVGTRDNKGEGRKENVLEISSLWAEVDFKDTPPAEVKANLDNFPLRPSAAILSGHGVHFYWILKEPSFSDDFDTIEDILRRLCAQMKADPANCEIARVLRVPGTMNVKSKPALVKIHWLEKYRYELEDFDFLPEVQTKKFNGSKSINSPGWVVEAFKGVPEGGNEQFPGRNVAAAKVAGYFVNKLNEQDLLLLLQCWNQRNLPPLSDRDIRKVFASISKYGEPINEKQERIRISLNRV